MLPSSRGSGGGPRVQLVEEDPLASGSHPLHSLCCYPTVAGKQVSQLDVG